MYKLFVEDHLKEDKEAIKITLVELLAFEGKREDQVNIRSQLEINSKDIVNTMKEQHYKNVFWNLKSVYKHKGFIDNYYSCMLEQFDEYDEIEVNMDFILESLLGYDIKLLLCYEELYEDILYLARLVHKVIRDYLKYENQVNTGDDDMVLDYIVNSIIFDRECERHPESDPFSIK